MPSNGTDPAEPLFSTLEGNAATTVGDGNAAPADNADSEDAAFRRLCAEQEQSREELRVLMSAGAGAWP